MRVLESMWYGRCRWGVVLAPLGWAYAVGARARRSAYRHGVLRSQRAPVPVIVVGNIAVGGTGKTPLVIWLVEELARRGYAPGILCSGYGGAASAWPQEVHPESDPEMVGDEAVLLARRTGRPVVAGRDRVAGAGALAHVACDVIVCDDGLQHYPLQRDIEIVVVDGARRHGTGWCMPAGPLREPPSRLREVDFVIANGRPRPGETGMTLVAGALRAVRDDGSGVPPEPLGGVPTGAVHAVAGIGNPTRFFDHLRELGYTVIPHPFPDHHRFRARDLAFGDDFPIVMTEKDAVKCRGFATARCWYLPVRAVPDPALAERLLSKLSGLRASHAGGGGARP